MAIKPTASNPKKLLLQKIYTKLEGAFNRHMGEMGRARVSATSALRGLDKMSEDIEQLIFDALSRTELPVVGVSQEAPAGAHWLVVGLSSPRNALYGRGPVGCNIAYIEKDGTCPLGAVMLPAENLCAIAETGLGVHVEGLGRLRCGNRMELEDTLALLPWKTADVVEMDLIAKLDAEVIHTRKTGNTMADVVDVACGRADIAIGTRVNRLEALLGNLIMAESGGFASDLKGKALGPTSDTMVMANPKLHGQVVKLLA